MAETPHAAASLHRHSVDVHLCVGPQMGLWQASPAITAPCATPLMAVCHLCAAGVGRCKIHVTAVCHSLPADVSPATTQLMFHVSPAVVQMLGH